ncbi:hypothetical protein KPH14_005011 [Odynerus spinipes]|uniref:Mitochondrial ribosomal protein L37 n=1 Tax=Odynerus spinipes TaxID=1348599 RepID=A0AAD9RN05_9HYME|nr:hypothetical protein KPH14_005011 [Odynerus spinipes]
MRLTQALGKYHLGRLIRRVWQQQRERKPADTQVESKLAQFGIKIIDPIDKIQPKREFVKIEPEVLYTEIKFDETHPDWKNKVCLTYRDHNVLQNGTAQAQLLTKTIHINNELPQQIIEKEMDVSEDIHHLIERTIKTSTVYDAHQELLPKRKDPNRPAWNFPRDYGLTDIRKTHNLFKKLLQICECVSGPEVARTRSIFHNGITSVSIEKESKLLQFALSFDLVVVSTKPLTQIEDQNALTESDFPNIYPFHSTVSLEKTNIYRTEDLYPIETTSPWSNVHTIFISHNPEEVKNLSELPVTEDQIQARSMIKSFTAAAIFQLNTLDINKTEGIRNFWWSIPALELFEEACYESGQPVLKAYNPEVIKKLFAFYKNT